MRTYPASVLLRAAVAAGIGLAACSGSALASEGGGTIYPNGTEGYLAGALPPPGLYGMVYGQYYHATRVDDVNGHNLNVPGFDLSVDVIAPRLAWVTGAKVFGGDLVLHAIVPLVDLKVSAAGQSQSKTGIGDMVAGPGLGYHHSANLHSVVALDVHLPTGGYTKGDQANIGRHYSAIEPVYAVSYVDPNGLNGDIKAGWIFNQRNTATDYRSGQEFHFDYSLAWGFGPSFAAGLGGYYWKQMTSDVQAGATLANSKGETFAVGPSVKYDSGKGWFVTLKWQDEVKADNTAKGSAVWLKAVFPL